MTSTDIGTERLGLKNSAPLLLWLRDAHTMWGWVRMRLRLAFGAPFVVLAVFGVAAPGRATADEPGSPPTKPGPVVVATATMRFLTVSPGTAQVASAAEIVAPRPTETAPTKIAPAVSNPLSPKSGVQKTALRRDPPTPAGPIDNGAPMLAAVKPIGPRQVGRAAWYGGNYIGRHTTSGELLDTVHATAAHRDLPFNTLVRVTNLHNGRSVVVRITDRGPVSPTLLIDMSPKAAEELAMKDAGIVPVAIEQVVELPNPK
jgi:rare lipoprotein A